MLRLALRDKEIEWGAGVKLDSGVTVRMDEKERTVLREVTESGAAIARVATGEALVAKLERQRAAREAASKTARGSGSAAAAFDEASRKLEEWLDRERRSLGSFRRVAAILG